MAPFSLESAEINFRISALFVCGALVYNKRQSWKEKLF